MSLCFVDKESAERCGPAVVAARCLVFEYGESLPEDYGGGDDARHRESVKHGSTSEDGRVDAVCQ